MAVIDRLPDSTFRHEALMYAGQDDFLASTSAFIRGGVQAGEPTLVVISAAKIAALRETLGADADGVVFADMAGVGANPARIIPAWRDFVHQNVAPDRRLRGIGEPIWAERSPTELIECQRHESLLNVAFEGADAWWLLCPYDITRLDASVLEEARRSHPWVMAEGTHWPSSTYRGVAVDSGPFAAPLTEPADVAATHSFRIGGLTAVRDVVGRFALGAGVAAERAAALVQAVNEIAANSIRHGGGSGTLRAWHEAGGLVCEISDSGRLDAPLAGRERPGADPAAARGLWLANQLCDLVQIRSFETGTVVRLHLRT